MCFTFLDDQIAGDRRQRRRSPFRLRHRRRVTDDSRSPVARRRMGPELFQLCKLPGDGVLPIGCSVLGEGSIGPTGICRRSIGHRRDHGQFHLPGGCPQPGARTARTALSIGLRFATVSSKSLSSAYCLKGGRTAFRPRQSLASGVGKSRPVQMGHPLILAQSSF